ncbi:MULTISPECIES: penicillin-binding protein 1A [Novosphingopyxis]|uniref:penicillin-binding protein 1A n=1 Tax=Novosphingopyxis TaxID=2709686 RepID=UPI001650E51A|nr:MULTISPECIES: transglycosylase domain-containing protein [Novosphingopyxis]MBH9536956.1 transglycosylase domain-containing protein [Novosphingopyxis sp. YJ-S2-01]
MEEADTPNFAYRLRRDAGGMLSRIWQNRWLRYLIYLGLLGILGLVALWFFFARGLPDANALLEYEPPLPTIVRDVNGEPFHSYARERRVQLQYADFPPLLVRAYLAAEDRTFFEHGGLDYPGIASAMLDNVTSSGRARGASTITQQVAKNILLTNEYSYTRKLKEAILAFRMEDVLTKQQILELYLNEIYLGRNAYGVQAAAQAYFGKDVDQLALNEIAYLAILPKGPSNYRPENNEQRAIERRNWALGEMRSNGWITDAQYAQAVAMPLGTIARQGNQFASEGGYFVEEVRRRLIDRFGETAENGPYSVYAGGLWVRSSFNPQYQEWTTEALRDGLQRYDAGKPWKNNIGTIDLAEGNWASQLSSSGKSTDYKDWRIGVYLGSDEIGFSDGSRATLTGVPAAMEPGMLTAAAPNGSSWAVRKIPEVGGGMVVEEPTSGRIFAMQGGFDNRLSSFNRATQAMRQPGSTIKPFVYASAIDQGMTPATMIVDGTFCVYQGAALGQKCFRNFGNAGGSGAHTMRWGLEQSRNLMTVRAANDTGMPNVVKTIKTMGIGDYKPYLSFALGAGDTTVEKMVNAFSMLVNHGRKLDPTVIDFAQDRSGKVIWPKNWKACKGCNADDWNGQPMPRFTPDGKQLMDPVTAYQVVHMLEGVVQRGTATVLRDLNRPLFGKTGTTTGPTNVWFIGGSPDLVAGVYMGFDQPRSLGGYAQGGRLAAPIFKQFAQKAFEDMPARPFTAPDGVRMVRIDRRSGRRVYGAWPEGGPMDAVIWEAFKPETEPKRTIRTEEIAQRTERQKRRQASGSKTRAAPVQGVSGTQRDNDFMAAEGGIY